MQRLRFVPLLALVAAAAAIASDGVHKWYDEDGQAVYSQFAPPQGQQSEIVEPPPPPAEDPEVAQRRLQEQLQRSADYQEDQELAAEKAEKQRVAAGRAQARCTQARETLQVLNGPARQLFQLPDGTVTRLSEEERQARRVEAQKVIDESCR
jgi:hypothetical protein